MYEKIKAFDTVSLSTAHTPAYTPVARCGNVTAGTTYKLPRMWRYKQNNCCFIQQGPALLDFRWLRTVSGGGGRRLQRPPREATRAAVVRRFRWDTRDNVSLRVLWRDTR